MKTIYFVLCVFLTSVLFGSHEVKAQSNLRFIQYTGYCAGLYPADRIEDTSTDIRKNVDKIYICINKQQELRQKIIALYARYTNDSAEIIRIYKECGWKSYDPHYLNMRKLYNCIKTIIDKEMGI